jgi:hypothetical protein
MLNFYAVTKANRKPNKALKEQSHAEENLEMGKLGNYSDRDHQNRNTLNIK